MKRKLKAVIFDMGGTLLDFDSIPWQEAEAQGFKNVYDRLVSDGYSLPSEDEFIQSLGGIIEEYWSRAIDRGEGVSLGDVFAELSRRFNLELPDSDLLSYMWSYYYPLSSQLSIFDSTRETLISLKERGLKIGLISNTLCPGELHQEELRRFDILELFDDLKFSSDFRYAKPHPSIFRASLEALGVEPEEAVFVGDRIVDDVSGAQGVGMKGILRELDSREEKSDIVVPDGRIRSLRELEDILDQLYLL